MLPGPNLSSNGPSVSTMARGIVILQPLISPVIGWRRAEFARRLHVIGSGVILTVSGKSFGSPRSMRPPRNAGSASAA